jgi:protein farnesyltransferase subunit beta
MLVTATILDILTPELVAGTPAFIASCQTYEGGFACASQPYYSMASTLLDAPRPPLGEAHGGYTFCAIASWVLLEPFMESTSAASDNILPGFAKEYATNGEADERKMTEGPQINMKTLLRWLVQVQGTEAELGGFKGRTNKLVDGCYSWWCGGAFALLEALGIGGTENAVRGSGGPSVAAGKVYDGDGDGDVKEGGVESETWDDVDGSCLASFNGMNVAYRADVDSLFNRKALQEYILYATQHPAGGLRDKPPKYVHVPPSLFQYIINIEQRNPDAYHTLYCLSGLSAAQHHVFPSSTRRAEIMKAWVSSSGRHTTTIYEVTSDRKKVMF